jgi:polyisoprenoid-binding protein YceI
MRVTIPACVTALFLGATALAADSYTLDPAHTAVAFSVRHMVVSTVHGRFNDMAGTIVFNDKDPSKCSVKVTIKSASVDTGILKRDQHLRSADFFDVTKFPDVTFESKKVAKKGAGYEMTGTLTIKGVSKEVSFPFTLSGPVTDLMGKARLGAEASLAINRQDYGISWNKTLDNGGLLVANDVKLELDVEAVKETK